MLRPFDEIESDIAAIAQQWSEGFALYRGYDNPPWTHARKALLAQIESRMRAEIELQGGKVIESRITSEAHAHPDYVGFLEAHRKGCEEWAQLDLRRTVLLAELRHTPLEV